MGHEPIVLAQGCFIGQIWRMGHAGAPSTSRLAVVDRLDGSLNFDATARQGARTGGAAGPPAAFSAATGSAPGGGIYRTPERHHPARLLSAPPNSRDATERTRRNRQPGLAADLRQRKTDAGGRVPDSRRAASETRCVPRHSRVSPLQASGGTDPTSHPGDSTPGRTPLFSKDATATPTHFDQTPLTAASATPGPSRRSRPQEDDAPRVDANLSLDAFQARYTSQDNASFQDLVVADNAARRDKHAWAWHAEQKANIRAIKAREARERLVDVTRRMVESSGDGTVRLLDGPAGKPGERRLLVDEGVDVGTGPENRLLVTGRDEKERLLITNGEGPVEAGDRARLPADEKEVDERAQQFIDWDRATAEEKDDNKAIDEDQLQVPTSAWPFKVRFG